MTAAPVTAPVDVMAKLSTVLGEHHAPHLLGGVLACLAPHLHLQPFEGGRRACDATAVVALARVLAGDGRPDLLTHVLMAVTPWLPATPVGAALPPTPPSSAGLTVRQTEMLHLVSYGLSNGEIGRKLFLSEDTVKTHLRRAYRALGARDRAHAIRLCLERGVLKSDTG